MNNYLNLNGKKIPITDKQVKEIEKTLSLNKVILKDVAVGETFEIGEIEFIKFSEKNGETTAVTKDLIFNCFYGDTDNFKESQILKRLETEFLPKIIEKIGQENVFEFKTDLLALDGTDEYKTVKSKISIPTFDFYRKNKKTFDKYNPNEWWWLATADSTISDCGCCVTPSGLIESNDCSCSHNGVRPFCVFSSNILVSK